MRERIFDRKYEYDAKSANFPVRREIETRLPKSYTWRCDTYNDQGSEGACVGFAWSHELAARPKPIASDAARALQIYRRAQVLDSWPGEGYSGTSVLAGAKATQEIVNATGTTVMPEYRWAAGSNDLTIALGHMGPAVLGVNWHANMFNTDPQGFIHVDGEVMGGHAILCRGVRIVKIDRLAPASLDNIDRFKSYFVLHNSWGADWGVNGMAKIRFQGIDTLLNEEGEACIPVLRTS